MSAHLAAGRCDSARSGNERVVSLDLPTAPSANRCWRNAPHLGRVKTAHYRAWCTEAGWELRQQRPTHVAGLVTVMICAGWPERRRDVDNIIKPTLDLIVDHGVIDDDDRVISVTARWDTAITTGRCRVTIEGAAS